VSPALQTLIGIALSGGLLTGIAAFVTSRSTSRQMKAQAAAVDAKLPAEIDSISVTNAERAVLTMGKALEDAERRIADLRRREEAAEQVITQLRGELANLRRQIDDCNASLRRAQDKVNALTERLAAIDTNNGRGA
jgi:chromosome segregation ATPase